MEKKLAIIIPTYNESQFIVNTLKGILSQDSDDYVVYIVDDCSKDDTVSLIHQHYANEISSGKIDLAVLSENSGSAVARQHALSRVTTKFVSFVDADDSFASNHAISAMCNAVDAVDADVYMFSYFTNHGSIRLKKSPRLPKMMTSREALIRKVNGGHPVWHYLWNKIYRMSVIRAQDVVFRPALRRAQDVRFNDDFLIKARNVCYFDTPLYVYNCTNPKSVSARKASTTFGRDQFLAKWQRLCERYDRLLSNATILGCANECEMRLRRNLCSNMISSLNKLDSASIRKSVEQSISSSAQYEAIRPFIRRERIRYFFKSSERKLRDTVKKIMS